MVSANLQSIFCMAVTTFSSGLEFFSASMHFVSKTTNKQYSTDSVTQVSQLVSSYLAAHLCVSSASV